MSKKKYPNASRNNYKNKRPSYWGLWLLTIFLFLAFTFLLVFLGKHKSHDETNTKSEESQTISQTKKVNESEKETNNKEQKSNPAQKPVQQKFDFYDLLTNTEKSADNEKSDTTTKSGTEQKTGSATKTSDASSAKATTKPDAKTSYILEIVKTKDYEAVDHIKAELALLGFEANVTTVKKNKGTAYLVTVGPYEDKTTALNYQKQIQRANISCNLKKF
jgi:cell division protein FtsN